MILAALPLRPIQKQSRVDFQEVKATFIRDNVDTPGQNAWPLRALEIANAQLGEQTRGSLARSCWLLLSK
jgi:hypothetical protein